MSELSLNQQLNIYDQLSGKPRRDFFDMQHYPLAADEKLLEQTIINHDWNLALEENTIYQSVELMEDPAEINDAPELFNKLWHGDTSTLPAFYEKYMSSAEKLARKYIYFVEAESLQDDLLQSAQVGLCEAAQSIMEHRTSMNEIGAVIHYRVLSQVITELWRNNHFGSKNYGRKQRALRNTEKALAEKLGRTPQVDEIAEEMTCGSEEVRLLQITKKCIDIEEESSALDSPSTEGSIQSLTLFKHPLRDNSLLSESTEDIVLDTINNEIREQVMRTIAKQALKSLDPFDRDIFERFYGLNSYAEPQPSKEIAEIIGETNENVRQILSRRRRQLEKLLVNPYENRESEPVVDGRF
ncbi:MAG: sigma-70 family RNA polymerase sigma factor [Candidatus Saccharimonadales bacterium]